MGMTHQCATVQSLRGGFAGREMTRTSISLRVTGSSRSQRKTEQCVLCSDLWERKTSKAAGLQPSIWHVALREPIRGVTTCRATRGLTGSSARAPDDVAATVVAALVRSSARRILLIALPRPRGTRLEGLLSRCYLGSAWAYQSPLHPKHAPFESNSTLRRPSSTHVSVFTNPLTPLIDLIIFSCP